MGNIQIHTAYGWVDLEELIIGIEKCSTCGLEEDAEGAGYVKCDPPELRIWLCRKCRVSK
jgi:hypothetical protein